MYILLKIILNNFNYLFRDDMEMMLNKIVPEVSNDKFSSQVKIL